MTRTSRRCPVSISTSGKILSRPSIAYSTMATLVLILGIFTVPLSGHSDPEQLVIIVNKQTPIHHITIAELKRLFLKQRQNWADGSRVLPINGKNDAKARSLFRARVLDMSETEEETYWQKQKVKKGRLPPPEFRNIQKAIFSLKGSIGYCLQSEHNPGTSRAILVL